MKRINLIIILFFILGRGFAQTAEELYKEGLRWSAQKNYAEAENFFTKAILLAKDSAKYYLERGKVNLAQLKYNDAYSDYTSAININKNYVSAYLYRADLLLIAQKSYESIKDANMAIMLTPYDSVKKAGFINNAVARTNIRDFVGAYNDLMKALSFDSLDPIVYTDIGSVFDEQNDTAEAIKYNMKAFRIDTNFFPALANVGFIRSKAGNYKGALSVFNKILKVHPEMAFVWNNRGYTKIKLGDLDGALIDIEQSMKLNPTNSFAYRNRALVYIEQKKIKKACVDLQKAKELNFMMMYGDEVEQLLQKYCK